MPLRCFPKAAAVPPPRERGLFIEKQASVVARSPSRTPRAAICVMAISPLQPQQTQSLRQRPEPLSNDLFHGRHRKTNGRP